MNQMLVRAVDVHKHFGHLHVLRGIDLEVVNGEVVCLLGPSGSVSLGRYGGTRGAGRLLEAFHEHDVRASWFIPGKNAELYRSLVAEIHAAGHEIGNHGYEHENFDRLDLAEQLTAIVRGREAIAEAIGLPPLGFRVPFGEWAPGLADELLGVGLFWSSAWRGDDMPYFHATRGNGLLVEVPLHYELEDYPYFIWNLDPPLPPGQSRIAPYREVLNNWKQEFDAYYRYGLCYVLRLHPEVCGTPGRIGLVRELLEYMQSHSGVWFATGVEVAEWWRRSRTSNEPGHPADVFNRLTEAPNV